MLKYLHIHRYFLCVHNRISELDELGQVNEPRLPIVYFFSNFVFVKLHKCPEASMFNATSMFNCFITPIDIDDMEKLYI